MTLYSTLLFPVSRSTCFGHIPCPSSGAQFNCTHSIWGRQTVSSRNFLKLIPDAQNDKHNKLTSHLLHPITHVLSQIKRPSYTKSLKEISLPNIHTTHALIHSQF
jgi:hypothetical protein